MVKESYRALSVVAMTMSNQTTLNEIFAGGAPTPLSHINKPDDAHPYATDYLYSAHIFMEPGSGGEITDSTQAEGGNEEISVHVEEETKERWDFSVK